MQNKTMPEIYCAVDFYNAKNYPVMKDRYDKNLKQFDWHDLIDFADQFSKAKDLHKPAKCPKCISGENIKTNPKTNDCLTCGHVF